MLIGKRSQQKGIHASTLWHGIDSAINGIACLGGGHRGFAKTTLGPLQGIIEVAEIGVLSAIARTIINRGVALLTSCQNVMQNFPWLLRATVYQLR